MRACPAWGLACLIAVLAHGEPDLMYARVLMCVSLAWFLALSITAMCAPARVVSASSHARVPMCMRLAWGIACRITATRVLARGACAWGNARVRMCMHLAWDVLQADQCYALLSSTWRVCSEPRACDNAHASSLRLFMLGQCCTGASERCVLLELRASHGVLMPLLPYLYA
jgi:hypothetical protein